MSAAVTPEEIEDSVRRHIRVFHRHEDMSEGEIVEEVTAVIRDDIRDGSWFLESFTALMDKWDDGTDHFGYIEELADVYRAFYCEDLIQQVIRHYHNPLLSASA